MSDAYAAAGVDTAQADEGVSALVDVLKTIDTGRQPLAVPLPGHYASVIRLPGAATQGVGIALATDSVGSKVIVAAQMRRFDTIGIDCVAMNVNDLICIGARPLALLDYVAVEHADPELLRELAKGLTAGATAAGVEIPGGEVCQVPELLRGHPSPYGFDLVGSAFGTVALDAIIDGSAVSPGDAIIGIPASGVHSNGLTLARRALFEQGGLKLEAAPAVLAGQTIGEALLEPTVIYVRAVLELLDSELEVHGMAHITGGGLMNLRRVGTGVGYSLTAPLPSQPIYELIADAGEVSPAEMWEVFNMGCGFMVIMPAAQARAAVELLGAHHPGSAVIGTITDHDRVIEVPPMGIRAERGATGLTGP